MYMLKRFEDCSSPDGSSPDDSPLCRKKILCKTLSHKLFNKSSSYVSNVHLIYPASI